MIKKLTISLGVLSVVTLMVITLTQLNSVSAAHKPSHKKPTSPLTSPKGHGHSNPEASYSGVYRFITP